MLYRVGDDFQGGSPSGKLAALHDIVGFFLLRQHGSVGPEDAG